MDWLKKAPTAVTVTVIIVCGFLAAGLVASFVILTLAGADTTEFRQWVNTIGQILVYPLLGTTAVASVAAARSASRAEDQTNGQLTDRDNLIARQSALIEQHERALRTLGVLPTDEGDQH
jgi:fructose-specific phosphotransferase system IIC component